MPPRLRICVQCLRSNKNAISTHSFRRFASVQAIAPKTYNEHTAVSIPPISSHAPSQPPSHRPPEFRRSQLHRQYASMLRSSPMIIFFQHSDLKATEWMGVRRELSSALKKVDNLRVAEGNSESNLAESVKLQVIHGGVFGSALKVVEYYQPRAEDPTVDPSASLTHGLSRAAHDAVANKTHPLTPLLSGPLAVLTFPSVSTEHLKAALSILSPFPPLFAAPRRATNPGYHDPAVQAGVHKLLLLGARVEEKVFDFEGARWVGSIDGGLDGLRAQLVAMLQGVGASVTNTLESSGRSIYFTLEGRKEMLQEPKKEATEGEQNA